MLNKPENVHPSAIRAKQDHVNNTVYPINNKNDQNTCTEFTQANFSNGHKKNSKNNV